MPVNGRPGEQAEDDELATHAVVEPVDQHVDADVDAGAHAVGGAELGHPDEHDDAQFLGPAEVERQQPVLQARDIDPGHVAVHDRGEDDQRRRPHQEGHQQLFEVIERLVDHCDSPIMIRGRHGPRGYFLPAPADYLFGLKPVAL